MRMRFDAVLVALVVASALGVISAQHQARKLYAEFEREQARAHSLEVEWGQLQLEQSTWAAHARVEKLARERLGMRPPVPGQVLLVEP
ncbi:cell division protein FtsL [Thauera linaloolentis]|uniref:Cell division protein FtsL n=1 Tax=Thauera linaloolentis (strain DSM 12138 / JCM 21573 / CCUG 41526 / CIP 105981 / IAM 15112 / NBRC 102519 / 47Lol) TaxID=1123367 RepID=N6YTM3_THAL4|nr:cell division protein FtsL [Thauera linaloolentis]ENO85742.1 putative cell division protein FtsL [Thauera linaloolentis 47Lol = DSM 12138]MCM8564182.1 cell division protein FtsL [Thauera linaloolentis]